MLKLDVLFHVNKCKVSALQVWQMYVAVNTLVYHRKF